MDCAHRVPYQHPCHALVSTDVRQRGSLSIPIHNRTGSRKNCCSILLGFVVHAPSRPLVMVYSPLPVRMYFSSQALLLNAGCRFFIACAGSAAQRVCRNYVICNRTARFFIVHYHATKVPTDITGSLPVGSEIPFGTFQLYMNPIWTAIDSPAHGLDIAFVLTTRTRTPIYIFFRFPNITAFGKTKSF